MTDWIGNSPDVAKMHYLQTHDEYFKRAAKPLASSSASEEFGTGRGQKGAAGSRMASQTNISVPAEVPAIAGDSDTLLVHAGLCETQLAPPRGVEPLLPG